MATDATQHTRQWTAVALAAAIIASAAIAACGGGQQPRAVHIALTAPTEGAVLDESRIKVFGTVEPSSARVDVEGRRAHVANGGFARWMTVRRGRSHIRIVATAAGYLPANIDVAVTSTPTPSHVSSGPRPAEGGATSSPTSAPAHVSHYSTAARATFLRTCKAAAYGAARADARCECALAYLEAHIRESRLAAAEREVLAGRATLPGWFREAALACRAA
jgi:hypothetical protein